jgi:Ca2+-transporting ATPase
MSLQGLYALSNNTLYENEKPYDADAIAVIETAMWASEPIPFDPMEKTLHHAYELNTSLDVRHQFEMVHEYPLGGKPPMMTHIFENSEGQRIIAAKGAPEAILAVCKLTPEENTKIRQQLDALAIKGYRMLGVADATFEGNAFRMNNNYSILSSRA